VFIHTIQQKTKIAVKLPLLAPAKKILDEFAAQRDANGGYLLPRISNQRCNSHLREIAGIVGIRNFSHHVARHTFATVVLLDNDIDLKTVSDLLGHDSIKSSEGYSKTTKRKLLKVAERVDAEYLKQSNEKV
jgi:site-specific recombinase XerD